MVIYESLRVSPKRHINPLGHAHAIRHGLQLCSPITEHLPPDWLLRGNTIDYTANSGGVLRLSWLWFKHGPGCYFGNYIA